MTPVLEYPAPPRVDTAASEVVVSSARVRKPRRLLAVGLGLGALANAWLPGGALGLGFTTLIYLWAAALLWAGGREAWQAARGAKWLLAGALFFATMISVRASGDLTALNALACFGLLGLTTFYWSPGHALVEARLRDLVTAFFSAVALGPLNAAGVLRESLPEGDLVSPDRRSQLKSAGRAALIALPFLLLFGNLFGSADVLFAQRVRNLFSGPGHTQLAQLADNTFATAGFSALAAGFLAFALRRRQSNAPAAEKPLNVLRHSDAIGISVGLVGLFAFFAIGQTGVFADQLPEEHTWSEYARQGFEQLLLIGLLTLTLVVTLPRLINGPASRTLKGLLTVLIALTQVVLVSAVHRLELYEQAYGFTSTRVMSHAFAVCLGLLLAWRAVTLWKLERSFGIGAVAAAALFVGSLDVLNLDAFIAEKNIERQDRILDEGYLGSLSTDAAPAIDWLERPARLDEVPLAHWNWSRATSGGTAPLFQ